MEGLTEDSHKSNNDERRGLVSVGSEPGLDVGKDLVLVPVVPQEVVGLGIEVEGFIGSADLLKPAVDLFGPDEDVATGSEDKCRDADLRSKPEAGLHESSHGSEETKGENADVVGGVADAFEMGLVTSDGELLGFAGNKERGMETKGRSAPGKETDGQADKPRGGFFEFHDRNGKDDAARDGIEAMVTKHPSDDEGAHTLAANPEVAGCRVGPAHFPDEGVDLPGDGVQIKDGTAPGGDGVEALAS